MTEYAAKTYWVAGVSALAGLLLLTGCQGNGTRSSWFAGECAPPTGHNLQTAFERAREDLSGKCAAQLDAYFERLLKIAEGDPKPENRQRFSEFLLWAADTGLLSRRQAQLRYNRYFNVKFVSMMNEYSTCSRTCGDKPRTMINLKQELVDKEQGLLKVSADRDSYQRAERLYRETELVLEATCSACTAAR